MTIGNIRNNQLITTYGPGSIFDTRDGFSVVISCASTWLFDTNETRTVLEISEKEIKKIVEAKLAEKTQNSPQSEKIFKIKGLMRPPIDNDGPGGGIAKTRSSLPIKATRFPRYHRCTRCEVLCKLGEEDPDITCKNLSARGNQKPCGQLQGPLKGTLEPIQFIMKCEHGHISDINWQEYMHDSCVAKGCKSTKNGNIQDFTAQGSHYYMVEYGFSNTFQSRQVICSLCNAKKSMMEVSRSGPSRDEGSPKPSMYYCNGEKNWRPNNNIDSNTYYERDDCGAELIFTPRGGSDVYISDLYTAISLPKPEIAKHIDLERLIDKFSSEVEKGKTIEEIRNYIGSDIEFDIKRDSLNFSVNEVLEEIESHVRQEEVKVSGDEQERRYLDNEFSVLTRDLNHDSVDFRSEKINILESENLKKYFNGIYKVERLKMILALLGFTRAFHDEEEDNNQKYFHPSTKNNCFVPSVASFGEGIFFELDAKFIRNWLDQNKDQFNLEQKELEIKAISGGKPYHHAKGMDYILVHSLSHALIKELAFHSGFTVTELCEKIYVINDQDSGNNRYGILIYTRSGDAQGSLGGLTDLCEPDLLEVIFKNSIQKQLSCSHDPHCSISSSGRKGLSNAACFGCLMLPEICCDCNPIKNAYLDRSKLINLDPENPNSIDTGFIEIDDLVR